MASASTKFGKEIRSGPGPHVLTLNTATVNLPSLVILARRWARAHRGDSASVLSGVLQRTPTPRNVFDVTADGQRFLVSTRVEGALSASITWVLNRAAELEP